MAAGSARQMMSDSMANEQWKLFTELDLHGEAEQIQLAGFLNSLVHAFDRRTERSLIYQLEGLDGDEDEKEGSVGGLERPSAEKVTPCPAPKALEFGPLPKGPISPATATAIIDVYRRGGRLSAKAVKKVLRDVYKVLKVAANVVSLIAL